jgi:hypothetical protein
MVVVCPLASTIGATKELGIVPNGVTSQVAAWRSTTVRLEASTLVGSLKVRGARLIEIGV